MNVMLKVTETKNKLKRPGFRSDMTDEQLISQAATALAIIELRYPIQQDDDDKCRLTIEQRNRILKAYEHAVDSEDIEAAMQVLRAVINQVLAEVKEK